ncbi:hypothetical protein HZF24_07440 [Sedimentibacter hydroxybenzoicus DSM 7310]|uniref:Uncharacterized protein n=1 Tax=Sedimentibacter hydroxybenzoicus DSM 7310 TaxID=1123245 RepID=A0A974GW19_SEDHY|nr:hypothetical protein [Sedimentibacter hydroxybenzoicus]NYB73973.1 hypothetical protein [Sedimentibacter hydroxybenzoicus DSM 7310]
MYYNENNVAGAGGRKINYANGTVAGDFCRRGCGNEVGGTGRRRCDCECVYGCLLELIEDAVEENNNHHHICCGNWVNPGGGNRRRCDCVYECLFELLEDALEEDNNNNNNNCCCKCCCRR